METLSARLELSAKPRLDLEKLGRLVEHLDRQHDNFATASFESSLATMVISRMNRE